MVLNKYGIILIDRDDPHDVGACQWHAPTGEKTIHDIQLPHKRHPIINQSLQRGCKKMGVHFSLQRNYHEHIIRNEPSLEKIQHYIIHNPQKWQDDKFFVN